jgi:hypothetical protein
MTIFDRIALRYQDQLISAGNVALPLAALGYVYMAYVLLTEAQAPLWLGLAIIAAHAVAALGKACLADKQTAHRLLTQRAPRKEPLGQAWRRDY